MNPGAHASADGGAGEGQDEQQDLWSAASRGATEQAVALVLAGRARVDAIDEDQRSALMLAAAAGHTHTAVALVERCGADPYAQDSRGMRARSPLATVLARHATR
jgi:ankyrin repeat protein